MAVTFCLFICNADGERLFGGFRLPHARIGWATAILLGRQARDPLATGPDFGESPPAASAPTLARPVLALTGRDETAIIYADI